MRANLGYARSMRVTLGYARSMRATLGYARSMRAKAEWLWIDSKFSTSTL